MDPLFPQIKEVPFFIPPGSNPTGLTTTTSISEDHTEASIHASLREPTASPCLPPAYSDMITPVHDSARVEMGDELGLWANENRTVISPDLEQKLRGAHYLPSDNPDDISAQDWRDQDGVGYFELRRLRELYAR